MHRARSPGSESSRQASAQQLQTALHSAAGRGWPEVVAYLLEHGANPALKDLLGRTPDDAYGAPGTSPVDPALNMGVQKFGRTTGHTTGTIQATNVTISVCFEPAWPWD